MPRAMSLAVLTILSVPPQAHQAQDTLVLAQQQQQQTPQQAPKRDCEKKQDEGVS